MWYLEWVGSVSGVISQCRDMNNAVKARTDCHVSEVKPCMSTFLGKKRTGVLFGWTTYDPCPEKLACVFFNRTSALSSSLGRPMDTPRGYDCVKELASHLANVLS